MPEPDSRVDAYIGSAAEFARPILAHLRRLVHRGCPSVKETLKWGMPHFEHHGILCGLAAFKQHCTFGFWKGKLLFGKRSPGATSTEAMGHFGRITSLKDLPDAQTIVGYVKAAARLNEEGVKKPAPPRTKERKQLVIPVALSSALRKNKKARATFEKFSYSHRREYVEWFTEAKRDDTRQKRLAQTIAWLAEGKPRHWKYAKC